MPRTHRPLDGPAAEALATLPESDAGPFERLAGTVLGSPGGVLGPALRAALPGTTGIRWLSAEGLAATARATSLTSQQWLSLYARWAQTAETPQSKGGRGNGGRPSAHGHAPGAKAAPRWF